MPNRAATLSWHPPAASSPAGRVIDAALALADEEGLDAVSIRRVAARIGMRPMSLYTHVASKDDLLSLMFDRMSAGMLVPEPLPEDGRELLRLIAERSFATYLAHPWMLHAAGRRPAPGPNQLQRAEQSATAAAALGIPEPQAWAAVSIVHEWTMGHALHVATVRAGGAASVLDPAVHPRAAAAIGAAHDRGDPVTFAEALDAVLDGIERRFAPSR